uniref:Exocyst subunit Exo70 family protein n=1 Tax=Leersia perrieri TaxID=77586 RepID=A0A0D9V178_9ORYZ
MEGDRGKKPVDTPADNILIRKWWFGDSDRSHGGCLFYGNKSPPFQPDSSSSSPHGGQPHDSMEVDTQKSEIPRKREDSDRTISARIKRSHQVRRRQREEDQEGRVHGNVYFDSICIPPLSWPEFKHNMEFKLNSHLDDIEKSIVVPIWPQPEFSRIEEKVDKYLVAAKNLTQLLEHPVLIETGVLHDRARSLLGTTISSIITEFCHLKVWRASPLRRLGYLPGQIWELSVRSILNDSISSTVSSSSSSSFTCSGSTNDSSDSNQASLDGPDERLAHTQTSFINIKSVSVLDGIASIITQGGHQHLLRGAFDRHYSILSGYIEILDIENILGSHMKDSVEILVNAWVRAMRIIIDVLTEMQRQLHKQNFSAFNSFKDEYFTVIATTSIMKLVAYGSLICNWKQKAHNGPSLQSCASIKYTAQMILIFVMMHRGLKHAMPELLALFSGQNEQIVLAEFHGLIDRSSANVLELFLELENLLKSQRLVMADIGVHHVTQHIASYMRLLFEKKNTIYAMLDGRSNAFGDLVMQLISSLEFMLEMNSRSLVLQGQKQDRLDQLITDYVEASWNPVISSFEERAQIAIILWPHQLFDKFNSSFEMIYRVQKTWKVTDPNIRLKLREAIIQKVIPIYQMQMENQSGKKQKSARYSVEQLESQLLDMFEG